MNNNIGAARRQVTDDEDLVPANSNNEQKPGSKGGWPVKKLKWLGDLVSAQTTGSALKIAVVMATKYANQAKGEAWPAIETLMADTGLGRTTVKEAIADLEKAGALIVVGSRKGGWHKQTNRYSFVFGFREQPDGVARATGSVERRRRESDPTGSPERPDGVGNPTGRGRSADHEPGEGTRIGNPDKEPGDVSRACASTSNDVLSEDWWPIDESLDKAKALMGHRYQTDCPASTIRFYLQHLVSGVSASDWDAEWLRWIEADMVKLSSGEAMRFDDLPARKDFDRAWMPSTRTLRHIIETYHPFTIMDLKSLMTHIEKYTGYYLEAGARVPRSPDARYLEWFEKDVLDTRNNLAMSSCRPKMRSAL